MPPREEDDDGGSGDGTLQQQDTAHTDSRECVDNMATVRCRINVAVDQTPLGCQSA